MNIYEKIGDNECKGEFKKKMYKVKGEERIMKNVINRKGISLVALVITIIVLVVLTGAVVITGVNVPQQGQLAVFKNNIQNVQDAVTMKMLNNLTENIENFNENAKWIGVANGYTINDIANPPIFGEEKQINGVDVVALDSSLREGTSINEDEFAKYYVDAKGTVYHTGFIYDGVKYYNGSTNGKKIISIVVDSQPTKNAYCKGDVVDITGLVVIATYEDNSTEDVTNGCTFYPALSTITEKLADNIQIEVSYGGIKATNNIIMQVKNWYEIANSNPNLNTTTPYVQEVINGTTYYAPIPKGFVASTVDGEEKILGGLVIYEGSQQVTNNNVETMNSTRNQFVWVPVNDSYTMLGDITRDETFHNRQTISPYKYDIPYLSNNSTTALAYWQASKNGHSGTIEDIGTYTEPYSNAGSWEKLEYQAMVTSVLKYGGFYVGRYETGNSVSEPVVKAGVLPITSIKWNGTDLMSAEPIDGTATYVARKMYPSARTDVGVQSTLIYGIQWDSIMCWANCYNYATAKKQGKENTGSVSTDCYKNIYDLAGNVREWTMEACDSSYRILIAGDYNYDYAISCRYSKSVHNVSYQTVGFRVALYLK